VAAGKPGGAWRALAERAVEEFRAALGEDLLAVAWFGSSARGEATPGSDLDLYVVARGQGLSAFERCAATLDALDASVEYRALTGGGYRPDPMPIFQTPEKLATHPWILLDIADHGEVLYDPSGLLTRELDAIRARLRQLGSKRIQQPDGTWYWDLKPDWRPGEIFSL